MGHWRLCLVIIWFMSPPEGPNPLIFFQGNSLLRGNLDAHTPTWKTGLVLACYAITRAETHASMLH